MTSDPSTPITVKISESETPKGSWKESIVLERDCENNRKRVKLFTFDKDAKEERNGARN